MLKASDLKYLRQSQSRLACVGEVIASVAVLCFFAVGSRNIHTASQLAAGENMRLTDVVNGGFQLDGMYSGIVLLTLERFNAGFMQILIGLLLGVMVYMSVSARRRNGRLLAHIESQA